MSIFEAILYNDVLILQVIIVRKSTIPKRRRGRRRKRRGDHFCHRVTNLHRGNVIAISARLVSEAAQTLTRSGQTLTPTSVCTVSKIAALIRLC